MEEKEYTPDEVLAIIGEHAAMTPTIPRGEKKLSVDVDGFQVYVHSMRYKTFFQKGFTCTKCGRVGTHFVLVGDDKSKRRHFELFSDDQVLMTKDHIIPVSRGGKDSLDNFQTMCKRCNAAKGNEVDNALRLLTPKAKAATMKRQDALARKAHEKARADAQTRLLEMKINWLFDSAFVSATGHALDEDSLLADLEQAAILEIKPSLSRLRHDEREELRGRLASIENYLAE